jgi:ribonuclease HIII
VLAKVECDHVISDQFADPAGLKRALMEKGRRVRLESRVRAEADIAVAAASVLARAAFLRKLRDLGEQWRMDLPKGAGSNVDQAARVFVAANGRDQLVNVAKLHFKTTQKI